MQEGIIAGKADDPLYRFEMVRRINEVRARIDLLASAKVQTAVRAWNSAWDASQGPALDAVKEKPLREKSRGLETELTHLHRQLEPHRATVVQQMRKDLKQKPWGRRKI